MRHLICRAWYAIRRRRFEADLAEEVEFHRVMKQRELEEDGLATLEATFATRRALGSVALARDKAVDVWIWPWLQGFSQDLRFATRLLGKRRSFTPVAVIVLALGIGVNGIFFTLVDMICIRGLPLAQPDRIMYLATRDARARNRGMSYRDFEDVRAATRTFTGIAAFGGAPMAVGDESRALDRFQGVYISTNALRLIGEAPIVGRDFLPEEDRPGAPAVAMIGTRVWKNRYGSDPSVIGRTIRVNGASAASGFRSPVFVSYRASLLRMPYHLKDGGRTGSGILRARRWTEALLISQFALTVVLLAHVALSVRSFVAQQRKDPPIEMSRLLTMSVALPNQKYRTPAERTAFYERLDERLHTIGRISSGAMASALPFGGASTRQLAIDRIPATPGIPPPTVWTLSIGARYFETMGLPVFRGRVFDDQDGTAGHQSAIVNQRFVEMYYPGADPIGQRIRLTSENAAASTPWVSIVGISPTVRQRTLPEPDPVVYLPYRADPPAVAALIVRGPSDPATLTPVLRAEVRALDPDLPLYRVMTMEQAVTESRWNGRVSNFLITLLTCIAVGLAAVGLYAVTAHAVAQRTQEIGIRIALGAQPRQVRRLVLRRVMQHLGVGLIVGLACTIAWQMLFSTGASPTSNLSGPNTLTDPLSLIFAAALLVVVAAMACLLPVRRATRLDPAIALRCE